MAVITLAKLRKAARELRRNQTDVNNIRILSVEDAEAIMRGASTVGPKCRSRSRTLRN